jgi:hypothetical protein
MFGYRYDESPEQNIEGLRGAISRDMDNLISRLSTNPSETDIKAIKMYILLIKDAQWDIEQIQKVYGV